MPHHAETLHNAKPTLEKTESSFAPTPSTKSTPSSAEAELATLRSRIGDGEASRLAGFLILDAAGARSANRGYAAHGREGFIDGAGETIVGSVRNQARHRPDFPALIFTRGGEVAPDTLTYRKLDQRARAFGSRIHAAMTPGEPVLLAMGSDVPSVVGLFACLYAGALCAPVVPYSRNGSSARLEALAAASKSTVLVASDDKIPLPASLAHLSVLSETEAFGDPDWVPPERSGADLALVQFTSGSVAEPKGVVLTHENMLANLEMLRSGSAEALRMRPR